MHGQGVGQQKGQVSGQVKRRWNQHSAAMHGQGVGQRKGHKQELYIYI